MVALVYLQYIFQCAYSFCNNPVCSLVGGWTIRNKMFCVFFLNTIDPHEVEAYVSSCVTQRQRTEKKRCSLIRPGVPKLGIQTLFLLLEAIRNKNDLDYVTELYITHTHTHTHTMFWTADREKTTVSWLRFCSPPPRNFWERFLR
jgi:hypothetical protein